jgi:glycosyltransferase involved in cell wall biosynthesis
MVQQQRPLLSIIIPTHNRAKYLKRSLDAVIRCIDQDLPNTEVIVIDGSSTDGTLDLIRSYSNRITKWMSEPDRNVAEALNKGFAWADGKIILMIGDDDEALPGSLSKMVNILLKDETLDAVFGQNQVFIETASGEISPFPQRKFVGDVTLQDLWKFPALGFFIPECMFARRKVFEVCKGYDEEFHYWGYLDLFFRMIKSGMNMRVVSDVILNTYQTVQSDSIACNGNERWKAEWQLVQKRHVPLYWRLWHGCSGEVSVWNIFKYAVRCCCENGFGLSPRQLLGLRAH